MPAQSDRVGKMSQQAVRIITTELWQRKFLLCDMELLCRQMAGGEPTSGMVLVLDDVAKVNW